MNEERIARQVGIERAPSLMFHSIFACMQAADKLPRSSHHLWRRTAKPVAFIIKEMGLDEKAVQAGYGAVSYLNARTVSPAGYANNNLRAIAPPKMPPCAIFTAAIGNVADMGRCYGLR